MKSRYGRVVKVLGMSLLVLALSPVTSPFSTCDLTDLLSDTARGPDAILQSKIADDGAPEQDPAANVPVQRDATRPLTILRAAGEPGPTALLVPLRI